MKVWSFYDVRTGLFVGRRFTGRQEQVETNTPRGLAAIEGLFDKLSQRVNVESGEVIDYEPPPPDDDHEWNAISKRWVKRPEVLVREYRARTARLRIEELERSQLRPLRELVIDPQNAQAVARLREIDAEIAALRGDL